MINFLGSAGFGSNTGKVQFENIYFLIGEFVHAAGEELIFRTLPFALGLFFYKYSRYSFLFFGFIISFLLFGVAHGNWQNIFMQGIVGGILFVWFWKWYSVDFERLRGKVGRISIIFLLTLVVSLIHWLMNIGGAYFRSL